jgi:hypothetical protein
MHGGDMRKEKKRLLHHNPLLLYTWMRVNDLLSRRELSRELERRSDVMVSLYQFFLTV